MERRFWNEKIECMPMEEIWELQLSLCPPEEIRGVFST
jgi:hypothetical protein